MNKIYFFWMVSLFFCCKKNININDKYWKNDNIYILDYFPIVELTLICAELLIENCF